MGGPASGMPGDRSGSVLKTPSRYMVLADLDWLVDTVAPRSLETGDTTGFVLHRSVRIRLRTVDESTGRAVWRQTLNHDIPVTCPLPEGIARMASESAKAILEWVTAAASKP